MAEVSIESLLKRAELFLEDGEFQRADEYAERVLDMDPECAEAYILKLCCELKVNSKSDLDTCQISPENKNYQKAIRFGWGGVQNNFGSTAAVNGKCAAIDTETSRKMLWAAKLISAGERHTVAVKIDGTVFATGENTCGQCDVADWRLIAGVSAGKEFTTGYICGVEKITAGSRIKDASSYFFNNSRIRGTFKSSPYYFEIATLRALTEVPDLVAIEVGDLHAVGLKSDGFLAVVGNNNDYKQKDVGSWYDIKDISAGYYHTVGLRSNGTVVAAGDGEKCLVQDWKDIVAISAGGNHTVGLRADGTVVAAGKNSSGECNVSDWKDIVAISAGGYHTIGLTKDGYVVGTGNNSQKQMEISGWRLFNSLDTIDDERKSALQREITKLKKEYAMLGIFKRIRKQEIEKLLSLIENELKTL